ncbi:MAG: sulfur carrier protein ThiS [Nautiliaceae bacterium]
MKITINGIEKEVRKGISIKELLEDLKVLDKTMAVAVNMKIIKKEEWDKYKLKENDKVEALNFVGGG